jgi:hypothetical protein
VNDASPARFGLLIIRASLEDSDGRLIARITRTADVVDEAATVSVVGTAEDVHRVVQAWLEALRGSSTAT